MSLGFLLKPWAQQERLLKSCLLPGDWCGLYRMKQDKVEAKKRSITCQLQWRPSWSSTALRGKVHLKSSVMLDRKVEGITMSLIAQCLLKQLWTWCSESLCWEKTEIVVKNIFKAVLAIAKMRKSRLLLTRFGPQTPQFFQKLNIVPEVDRKTSKPLMDRRWTFSATRRNLSKETISISLKMKWWGQIFLKWNSFWGPLKELKILKTTFCEIYFLKPYVKESLKVNARVYELYITGIQSYDLWII